MLRQLATPTVRVELVTGAVAGRVCMDRSALERVVVNLVVNARDAMPGGGVVRVETSGVEASATEPRDQVRITVSDQGEGMSPETLEHLFEPFFTTKALGRGTGLGLSTCQGLVRQAGGSIRVQSALGVGTTFDILLPRWDGEPTVPAISPAMRGSETVLVVEPDPARRDPMQHALRAAGYLVASARDGAEAFDRTQENGSRVDLLAVRPVLPDMSGRLLYQCLRHEYPDLRAVFLEPEEASFDPERLLRVVRSELDAR